MKFCKVADIEDWQQPEFQATAAMLKLKRKVRKSWEFIQVYNGLQALGLLDGQTRAIGLGVGHEPLIYAFTHVCQSVIATDLYDSQTWATASMATEQVYQQNLFEYGRDRLTVRHMDMTQIEYPDASFDFVWSCCSIEHVHNFRQLHQVFAEIHRVLKPGGIAALTTEFNPTAQHSYEPNMLFTDEHWINHWLTGNHALIQGFELLDAIDLTVTDHPGNHPVPRRQGGSIRALTRDIQLTSIAFFLRKTGAFAQPYHEEWLAPEIAQYFAGCDAHRSQQYAQAEALLQPLTTRSDLALRFRVGACHRLLDTLLSQGKKKAAIALCKAHLNDFLKDECSDHLMPIANCCDSLDLQAEAMALYQRIEQLPGSHVKQVERSHEVLQRYRTMPTNPVRRMMHRLLDQRNRQ
ncbi:MAG: class I SAM-dependent methyltransferase [Oculatellaceae cyanobacterium Prado106]|jgi:SAM-dependent methyltransferase|nr:class I SAM-dependent methyltransferase [Oculatellaceae cyanobacterium Prado106]